MRLSGIKVSGFKSFVDASHLPLPSNLTAVVGPNGCGKSNIIDAVRWVLGETSMRTLRSESMDDVIFNGSKARKPVGRASVELLFDNSDGTIAGAYAAYNEISVRRELTRDGSSQYYLNGAKCKKRDVTDLFLGTGLGLRSGYAIIEQGMVSRMIEAKPEELRQWLEEAAGISRYKERRRETESRIRGTRENLDRLNDLRAELATRLNSLQRQARNAEKYKEYKANERKLRGELLALRWRDLTAECTRHEQHIGTLQTQLETAKESLAAAHAAHESAEDENKRANHLVSEEQSRVYEAEAALSRHEQSLKHARELRQLKQQELAQLQQQAEALDAQCRAETDRQEQMGREIATQERQLQQTESDEQAARAAVTTAEGELTAAENRWEEFTQRAENPLVQTEGERVRVRELERALTQLAERIETLEAEQKKLNVDPLQQSLFDTDRELAQLNEELDITRQRMEALDTQLQSLRDERATVDSGLHEARQAMQGARGKLSSLETLQQAALREDDEELQGWLGARDLGSAPRLADVLRVESGWEPAVEHILGPMLQAPVTDRLSAVLDAGGEAPESGASVVHSDTADGGAPATTLAAQVTGPRAIVGWLASVHTADDLSSARQRAQRSAPGESVITRDGVWLSAEWVRYPRRGDSASGVIARGMLLRQLKADVERQQKVVAEREERLGEVRKTLQQMEHERSELGSRFDQRRHVQAERLAQRQGQAARLEQAQQRGAEIAEALEKLTASSAEQQAELDRGRANLRELEAVAERLQNERAEIQQDLAAKREQVQSRRQAAADAAKQLNDLQVRLAGARSQSEALTQSIAEARQRHQQLLDQQAAHQAQVSEFDAPVNDQANALESVRAGVETARQGLKKARDGLALAENRLGNALQGLRQSEAARESAAEALQNAKLAFEGLSTRRQGLVEQLDESGFDRNALLEGMADDATAEGCEAELERMARRIERLGAINLAAIQELEEAQERQQYLDSQYEDLTGALDTLEDAIRKIDRETKERFSRTFELVNTTFKARFPRLFGGGEAYLELTSDDLLNTGVKVMARPPGKRNSSIQLLSGGEKAMTAVALLLALFELTPAPFCMLDEVDAPLDDANVSRFVDVIREMSSTVQFIIITHNKITMELAEQLHGVTMAEPGVSRLVSVDVKRAIEMAEEAA